MDGPFHSGEQEIQRRAGVEAQARAVGGIIHDRIPHGADRLLRPFRLAVAASVDRQGGVRASLITGKQGFLAPVDDELLLVAAEPAEGEPLADDLAARPELGLLAFDPTTRRRLRINGRSLVAPQGIFVRVAEFYGNCSKYIQRRALLDTAAPGGRSTRASSALDEAQRARIAESDTFFIASFRPGGEADASHRGGFPGFVRAPRPDRLVFPNYPGNAMFNTLGNLAVSPAVGLLFVDFGSGDLLQIQGEARVRRDLGVEVRIAAVRDVEAGSPLRYALVESSPFNPSLRTRRVAARAPHPHSSRRSVS